MDPTPPGPAPLPPAGAPPGEPIAAAGPPPPRSPLPRPGEIALVVVPLFLAGVLAQAASAIGGLAWTQLFVFLLPAAAAAAGSNLRPSRFLRLAPPPRPGAVALGFVVGAVGYLPATGVMALAQLVYPARWIEAFDVGRIFRGPEWHAVALAALASLLAPLCEESAFRGWVQTAVGARRGPAAAIAASTIVFSIMHLDPVRLPALLVLGVTFGWLAWRAGSVWPSIAAHAANNGIASVLALAFANRPDLAAQRPAPGQVALQLALGLALLAPVLGAYRAVTPDPPPFASALVPLDPARPVARFSAARLPPRYVALALVGLAALAALVLGSALRAGAAAP